MRATICLLIRVYQSFPGSKTYNPKVFYSMEQSLLSVSFICRLSTQAKEPHEFLSFSERPKRKNYTQTDALS